MSFKDDVRAAAFRIVTAELVRKAVSLIWKHVERRTEARKLHVEDKRYIDATPSLLYARVSEEQQQAS